MLNWIRLMMRRRRLPTPGQWAARRAYDRAHADRREAERRRPEVDEAASVLREIRERNHFAEMFREAIEGGHR